MPEKIRLTQYSKGAGCGCKVAPAVLEEILSGQRSALSEKLLVGNDTSDDAAVFDMGNGKALISTTDFFMPVVDDAYDFGRVSACNAISDIYAMGGKPLMAIAILGWPVEKLPAELATRMIEGGRAVCEQAGIPLAGGHSIDSAEPIFGLAVTGEVEVANIKRNSGAKEGDLIYLTKPIGLGMVSTAHKRELALEEDFGEALKYMTTLNTIGAELGQLEYVNAMTDVTGFGLLGHLSEVCEASGVSARIEYASIPLVKNLKHYVSKMIYPDITFRNWKSLESKVEGIGPESLLTLCDPQTSGGLLISVRAEARAEIEGLLVSHGISAKPIGRFTSRAEKQIFIS